ncbi:MAG: aminotransferase class V-fold PLP-dependent enzyme, partial [Thermoanaerobaculia bacterium]
PLSRRRFLVTGSAALTAGALGPSWAAKPRSKDAPPAAAADLRDWDVVRHQFDLAPDYTHLGLFYLTSHPRPVRAAIESYRQRLDRNPFITVERSMFERPEDQIPVKVCNAIASYIGGKGDDIALTPNTTTGLSLLYHGLSLKPGDEILTTAHDHYVHHEAIRLATERNGASWRKIPLFDSYDTISADGIVDRIAKAIRPNTRVVGVTWVHSASGLRLPIGRIAGVVADANRARDAKDRVLLFVDGVHGVGVEDPNIVALGADAFAAGTHKWIFGPRGTGFVWAKPEVWAILRPLIPSFTNFDLFQSWAAEKLPAGPARANWFTPGGFQAFEHWWALPAAFDFHQTIGAARITDRIHQLNQQLNEGLRKLPRLVVYTPADRNLNAGLVCFDVNGMDSGAVVAKLYEKKIIASTTPYAKPFARLACGIMNTPSEVDKTIAAVRAL